MCKLIFTFKGDTEIVEANPTESDVYKAIGQKLGSLANETPGKLEVEVEGHGHAVFDMKRRNSYIINGIEYPSMFVTEDENFISGLDSSDYEAAYLTCINPESNQYKFYHLKPSANGINATYGRIGAERGEMFAARDLQVPYPTYMYWIRYYEKLSKGYVDQTDIYLSKKKTTKDSCRPSKKTAAGPSAELYDLLMRYAKHVVRESLVDDNITDAQVKEARRIYNELCKKVQLKAFNRWLMKLLVLSPRKIDTARGDAVSYYLAGSKDDFAKIILREESLLIAMETVAEGQKDPIETCSEESFARYGIDVFEATPEQKDKVVSRLSDQLKPKVKKVYRVIPRKQKAKFDAYLKEHHIKNVKELWHGSRNENWLSIITNSLQLNPNAQITGKMFGQGIYFAPSSMKSWGYTSFHGSHWARGDDSTAFMGVFATAYGKPYHPDQSTYGSWIDKSFIDSKRCNCLHAEASRTSLLNDEIVYYDESAVCLNYIVEFSA